MDTKKFEKLIDLIVNENEDQARALFHDIVVSKSREIYESIMDVEEGDEVGDLMSEVEVDHNGMNEAEDDLEIDSDMEMSDDGLEGEVEVSDDESDDLDSMGDMDDSDIDSMKDDVESDDESLEDRVVNLEDEIDDIMAKFEQMMADKEEDSSDDSSDDSEEDTEIEDEDFEVDTEVEDEDGEEESEEDEEESEEEVMESKLVPVAKPKHGDDGSNSRSIALNKPNNMGMGRSPVNFSHGSDSKGRSAPAVKANSSKYANEGGSGSVKMHAVAKPSKGMQASNTKSPLGESKTRRTPKSKV